MIWEKYRVKCLGVVINLGEKLLPVRKMAHFTYGMGIFFLTYFLGDFLLVKSILISICILGVSLELLRFKVPGVNGFISKIGRSFLRESEVHKFTGLTMFTVVITVSYLVFPYPIFLLSLFTLSICDPLASIAGQMFGGATIYLEKTWAGTFCFLVTSFIIAVVFFSKGLLAASIGWPLIAFIIAAVGTVCELASSHLDDNITIPLGVGLVAMVFS